MKHLFCLVEDNPLFTRLYKRQKKKKKDEAGIAPARALRVLVTTYSH